MRDPRYDMPDTVADGTVDYPHVCERCGEEDISVNVEAFEMTGEVVCDDCADAYIERWEDDNGQFGVGA